MIQEEQKTIFCLIFLKENIDIKIKSRGCADGRSK